MCTVLQQHLNQTNGYLNDDHLAQNGNKEEDNVVTSTPAPASAAASAAAQQSHMGRYFARHISPVRRSNQPTYSYLQVSIPSVPTSWLSKPKWAIRLIEHFGYSYRYEYE